MAEQVQTQEKQSSQAAARHAKPAELVPGFLNISLALWKLMIMIAAALTAGLSWLNGLGLMMIVFRTGTVILCLGSLAWLTNWMLNRNLLQAFTEQQQRVQSSEVRK